MAEQKSNKKSAHVKDISGSIFSRLTVIAFDRIERNRFPYWLCRCECGTLKSIRGAALKSGQTKSCGCLNRERQTETRHGMWGTKEYWAWALAKNRCRNPRNKGYRNYGGRGITFAAEWDTFERFFADMGPCPTGYSLDRIDNNAGYKPGNCRWTTRSVQMRNTRCTVMLTQDGVTLPLADWAELTGISQSTLRVRHFEGLRPPEIFAPVQKKYDPRKAHK